MTTTVLSLGGAALGAILALPWYALCQRILTDKYAISNTSWKFITIVLAGWVLLCVIVGLMLIAIFI